MRPLHVVVFGIVLANCGGDDGLSINANKDNFCSQIADVACHNLYQCCTEGEIENYLNVSDPRTQSQCVDDMTKACERDTAKLADALDSKRATFDSKAMNDCLNALVAPSGECATVDSMLPWVDACMTSAWVGAVSDGSMCYASFECAGSDSFCSPSQTCTALPGANQPCSAYGCAHGLYCSGSTCMPLVAEGGMCTSTSQCAEKLFCDTSQTTPVCTALHEGGERCTSSASCKSGQCNPGTCSNSPSTCYTDAQCYGRCQTGGGYCTTDSNCGEGTCSNSPTTYCSSDIYCDFGSGSGSGSGSGTCVFPDHCQQGTCEGDIVCASTQLVVDYCTSALGALPVPPSN
jgi:hypothetical protein